MRIFKYAAKNIIRNPLLSLSSIFVISLLILFVNILLLVLFASEKFIQSVNDRISFTINFQSGYSIDDMRVTTLTNGLNKAFSGIVIEKISKKQAFELLKSRNPDLASLIENTQENPLPDSLRIDNIPRNQYEAFDSMIAEFRDMLHYDKDAMNRKLLDYTSQFERVSIVVKLLQFLEYGVFALLGLFVFTVSVIIYTVISNSIFFQKQEIEIIELVGGRSLFIYGPFLLQGAFYGTGATFGVALFLLLTRSLIYIDFKTGPLVGMIDQIVQYFPTILIGEFIIFGLLGIFSSLIALRRYVRL